MTGAAGQAGQIREEVTVTLKLLQAYVTTKDGKPVTDLTAADFEVTDNGKVMPVTHFENHVLGGDDLAPGAPVESAKLDRQFFLFFDFAFTDFRSSRKARDAALAFIDQNVRPDDRLGVLSYSPVRGLTIHEYLTADHARVRNIVEAFGLRAATGRGESLTNFLYADELRHMQDSATATASPGVSPGEKSSADKPEQLHGQLLHRAGQGPDGRRRRRGPQAGLRRGGQAVLPGLRQPGPGHALRSRLEEPHPVLGRHQPGPHLRPGAGPGRSRR